MALASRTRRISREDEMIYGFGDQHIRDLGISQSRRGGLRHFKDHRRRRGSVTCSSERGEHRDECMHTLLLHKRRRHMPLCLLKALFRRRKPSALDAFCERLASEQASKMLLKTLFLTHLLVDLYNVITNTF